VSFSIVWFIGLAVPDCFSGAALHRAALAAAHRKEPSWAARLFERAALRYRAELRVEPLARLRVHQEIVRLRALGSLADIERCLEVERALTRLDRIETLEPPFDLVDARTLLATWHSPAGAPIDEELFLAA
jgi:hypothetical protein